MNDFQFRQQLEEKDSGLDYASKAAPKTWTRADHNCILGTLLKNWPEQSRDAVYKRIAQKYQHGYRLPIVERITTHRGGLQ